MYYGGIGAFDEYALSIRINNVHTCMSIND